MKGERSAQELAAYREFNDAQGCVDTLQLMQDVATNGSIKSCNWGDVIVEEEDW